MATAQGPIVVLTGAGASKPLGYPTTVEFFGDANAVPRQYEEIFQSIRSRVGNRAVTDIEDFLRVLQPADEFLRTVSGRFLASKLSSNWGRLVPEFAQHVRERCFDLYGKRPSVDSVRKLYLPLLALCGWERFAVDLFTANYDPVTDVLLEAADEKGLRAYDGFDALARWDPEKYEWSEPGLRVHRLHGSMSWVRDGERILNTRDYKLRRGPADQHLLVYPGFKGDPEHDRMEEVFQHAHQRLRAALKSAATFVAIGFSFRDAAINRVLAEALESNATLEIVVLNPSLPEGEERFLKRLLEDESTTVVHVAEPFGDAAAIQGLRDRDPRGARA